MLQKDDFMVMQKFKLLRTLSIRLIILGIVGGVLSLSFPETNKQAMMETIEAAERFYRGEKVDINENE